MTKHDRTARSGSQTPGVGSPPSIGQASDVIPADRGRVSSTTLTTIAMVAILGAGIGLFTVRLAIEGQRTMSRSDEEFDRGRLRESTLLARRAAALYAPGLAHIRLADARLDAIAAGAESARRDDVAILAWQAIRATEEQRSLLRWRHSERARRAEQRLAVLLASGVVHASLVEQQQISRRVLDDLEVKAERSVLRNFVRTSALSGIILGLVSVQRGIAHQSKQRHWLYAGAALLLVGVIAWAILLQVA